MRYTLSVTFFYVADYAFITGSPFVYIDYFGVAAQNYGFLFGLNIIGIMSLSFLNRKLVSRFALSKLLVVSSLIALPLLLCFLYWHGQTWGAFGVSLCRCLSCLV